MSIFIFKLISNTIYFDTHINYEKQISLPFMPSIGLSLSFNDDEDFNILEISQIIYSMDIEDDHLLICKDIEIHSNFYELQSYHTAMMDMKFIYNK